MNDQQSNFTKVLYTLFMLAMTIQASIALYDRIKRNKIQDHDKKQ